MTNAERRFFLSHLFAFACLAAVALPSQGQSVDPWATLRAVRESLAAAGAQEASFTQTYVPAGFSAGEKESGRLALSLPDCLRWDYRDPYPKSFLLCGGNAWAWNAKDKTGRRYTLDRKTEPGLDLLLLGVEDLKERYKAASRSADSGRIEISLAPRAKISPIKDAVLVVDPAAGRIVQVSYRDGEGNQTRFDLADYREIARRGTTFSPPAGIAWEDER
ncbi:MAG TPA: outer membrane lipoprotein carrier protein LolA [Thermoanaerobaculia bacterium]|nr:outer membrane lipoprotein carrier protein LolA [Thermoanaerobaculia bacterium]